MHPETSFLPGANLDYYVELRHSVPDLFPSEAWAWLQVAYGLAEPGGQPIRMLDLGCGGAGHWLMLEPLVRGVCGRPVQYIGVDLDDDLLALAKRRCPNGQFIKADLTALDGEALGDQPFDVVQCYGVGHLSIEEFSRVVRLGYRVTRRFLLLDPRLTHRRSVWDVDAIWGFRIGKYPRRIMNVDEFTDFVVDLDPVPARVDVAGYYFPFKKFDENVKVGDRPGGTFARSSFEPYLIDSVVTSWVIQKPRVARGRASNEQKILVLNARHLPLPLRLSERGRERVEKIVQYSYHPLGFE